MGGEAAIIALVLFLLGLLVDVGLCVLLCIVVCVVSLKRSSLCRALVVASAGAASLLIPLFLWSRFDSSAADPLFKLFIPPLLTGAIGFLFGLTRLVVTLVEMKRAVVSAPDR